MSQLTSVQAQQNNYDKGIEIKKLLNEQNDWFKENEIEIYGKRGKELGKDKFLKLLVTQLTHQNPLQPMDDTQFISQMAQFSALEQMTEVNKNLLLLSSQNRSLASFSLLGKKIEGIEELAGKLISGIVNEIRTEGNKSFLITDNGKIEMSNLKKVSNRSLGSGNRENNELMNNE